MKSHISVWILFLLGVFSCANAQEVLYPNQSDSSIIQIKDFYRGYGKVFEGEDEANRDRFGSKYSDSFIDGYASDLKLNADDIIKAELMLFENYNQVYAKDKRFNGFDFTVKDPKKYLCHYYRQYIGFINDEVESVVLIHLMNFRNKKKASRYFKSWDKNFSIGFGSFYEKNQKTFLVNLSKNEVKLY